MYALSFDMRSNLFALLAKNIAELEEHYGSLKAIDWFRKSVRDIRGYRVEEWSDFTESVRNG